MVQKPSNSQNLSHSTDYKPIGVAKLEGVVYRTVYTENNLETCYWEYKKRLEQESTRQNCKILFFNHIDSTPSTFELENLNLIFNSCLIGGIEKFNGVVYKLEIENKMLIRKTDLRRY